ncbi:MAG: hypothetical protein GX610_23660 [Rhodococcus sp.]|nr:hypothetical protein [Rhodococcus sp. (in: high G+C Gram-positive bacteria)]
MHDRTLTLDQRARAARCLHQRTGFTGLHPTAEVRALWVRNQGDDRAIAELIHQKGGLA